MIVFIQAQDQSGVWRTYQSVQNNSQRILVAMQEVKSMLPMFRVRAVESSGRLVDMLG
jgi:hypothetical protein